MCQRDNYDLLNSFVEPINVGFTLVCGHLMPLGQRNIARARANMVVSILDPSLESALRHRNT